MTAERIYSPKAEDIVKGAIVRTKLTAEPLTVEIPIINEVEVEVEQTDKNGQPILDKKGNPKTKKEKVIRHGFPKNPQFGRLSDIGHPLKSKNAFKATCERPLSAETLEVNKQMLKGINKKMKKLTDKKELSEKEEQELNRYKEQSKVLKKKTRTVSFYPTLNHLYYVIPPKQSKKKK